MRRPLGRRILLSVIFVYLNFLDLFILFSVVDMDVSIGCAYRLTGYPDKCALVHIGANFASTKYVYTASTLYNKY
jgi:hypothetical protein